MQSCRSSSQKKCSIRARTWAGVRRSPPRARSCRPTSLADGDVWITPQHTSLQRLTGRRVQGSRVRTAKVADWTAQQDAATKVGTSKRRLKAGQ